MAHDDLKKLKPIRIDGAGESGKLLAVDTSGHVEFTDTLMGPLTVSGDLMPAVSGQFNIGTSGANTPWKEVHADTLYAKTLAGTTIISGDLIPFSGNQYNLGSPTAPFNELNISTGTIAFHDEYLNLQLELGTRDYGTYDGLDAQGKSRRCEVDIILLNGTIILVKPRSHTTAGNGGDYWKNSTVNNPDHENFGNFGWDPNNLPEVKIMTHEFDKCGAGAAVQVQSLNDRGGIETFYVSAGGSEYGRRGARNEDGTVYAGSAGCGCEGAGFGGPDCHPVLIICGEDESPQHCADRVTTARKITWRVRPGDDPNKPAQATATVEELENGAVVGVLVNQPGHGYENPPPVSFENEGNGDGAAATTEINDNGEVTKINLTAGGAGYTDPPAAIIGPTDDSEPKDMPAFVTEQPPTGPVVAGIQNPPIGGVVQPVQPFVLVPEAPPGGCATDDGGRVPYVDDVCGLEYDSNVFYKDGALIVGTAADAVSLTVKGQTYLPNMATAVLGEDKVLVSGAGGRIYTRDTSTFTFGQNNGTAAGGTDRSIQFNNGGAVYGSSRLRAAGSAAAVLESNTNFGTLTGITGVFYAINQSSGAVDYNELTIGTRSSGHISFYTDNARRAQILNNGEFLTNNNFGMVSLDHAISSSGAMIADRHFCAAGVVVGKNYFKIDGTPVPHLGTKTGIPVGEYGVLNISGTDAEGMQRVVLHSVQGDSPSSSLYPGFIAYNTNSYHNVEMYANFDGGRLSSDGVLKIAPEGPPTSIATNIIISGYDTEFYAGGYSYMMGQANGADPFLNVTNDLHCNTITAMAVNADSTGILVSGTNGRVEARKWVGPASNTAALLINDTSLQDNSQDCGATQYSIKQFVLGKVGGGGGGGFVSSADMTVQGYQGTCSSPPPHWQATATGTVTPTGVGGQVLINAAVNVGVHWDTEHDEGFKAIAKVYWFWDGLSGAIADGLVHQIEHYGGFADIATGSSGQVLDLERVSTVDGTMAFNWIDGETGYGNTAPCAGLWSSGPITYKLMVANDLRIAAATDVGFTIYGASLTAITNK